ncbi:MAG TPA: TauD/TfdA family dioxygenase [Stellaceae bacterium]|nr:TauD/TfdA family dioxygenase [Stellaceae bacterium]
MSNMAPIEGRSVWLGSQIDDRKKALYVLSAAEIDEIDAALHHLRSSGDVDFPAITPASFPLPRFGRSLAALSDELRDGQGFFLLRGLPCDRYAIDDIARIYVGLMSHLGQLIPQSYRGELLGHVMDVSDIEAQARGYHAGGAQGMHTDNCDVVSLLCVRAAKAGGTSRIVSAGAVHNRLLEQHPDLLGLLYRGFVFRRMDLDAQFGSGISSKKIAIFSRESGQLTCAMNGSYIRRAVAAGEAEITSEQITALNEFKRIASSPEYYLDMNIGKGDIQFLNNRVILHGRTNYEDWPDFERRRHMMRIWLQVPAWPSIADNQAMHTSADHPGWLRRREPLMEMPSRHIAEMTRRKAECES